MPRNLYRRNGIWCGRIQLAGIDRRRSLRTRDRAEAAKRFKAWRDRLIAAHHFGIERYSWREAVVRYTTEIMPGAVKPGTAKRYVVSLRMVDPILGDLHLDEIDERVLARIASRKGATNATRRRDLTAISQVLRAASAWGWIKGNAARAYDRGVIPERRDPIVLPTDEEINALINACPNVMLRAIVRVLVGTGMRLEEVGGLERRNIDFTRKAITLDKTKTSRPRAIGLSAHVAGTLQALPVHLKCRWVFWHDDGERYVNLSSQLAAITKRAGVTFRRHDLRHRYAVDYLRAGGSIYTLQLLLGHKSIRTTEIYLDYLTPDQQLVAKRLGANIDAT